MGRKNRNPCESSSLIDKDIIKQPSKRKLKEVKKLETYIERIRGCCVDMPPSGVKLFGIPKSSEITFNSKLLDVVNEFHVRCICCNQHFYAKSFAEDKLSYFLCHINSFEHRLNLPLLPENEPIIQMCENNEWMCKVCEEFVSPQTIDFRKLSAEINYHLDSFAHQHNAMLMTDSESALLVALSFLPYFRNKIVNSKCTICDSQLSFTDEDHLKFTMHLHNLKKYIMETFNFDLKNYDDNKKTLLEQIVNGSENNLNEAETKLSNSRKTEITPFCDEKETTRKHSTAETSTPMAAAEKPQKSETSSTSNCVITELNIGIENCSISENLPKVPLLSKIEDFIMAVRKEVWKESLKPHPGTVFARSATVLKKDFDCSIYDIVNDVHAYCIPCQMHLYSTFCDEDITSYCSNHVNHESHLYNLKNLKEDNIFYLKSKEEIVCRACSCTVPIIRNSGSINLRKIIEKHNEDGDHVYYVNQMTDPNISLLVSLAFIPYFKNFVIDLECKLCNQEIEDKYKVENHFKSKRHLSCLKEFLNSVFHLETSSLSCDVTLKNLFEKMAKLEHCFGKESFQKLNVKKKLMKTVEILNEVLSEIDDEDIKWLLSDNLDEVMKIVDKCFSNKSVLDCSAITDSQLNKTENEIESKAYAERPIGYDGNKPSKDVQPKQSVLGISEHQNPAPQTKVSTGSSTEQNPEQQKQAVPDNTKTHNSVKQKQTVSGDTKVQNPTQQVVLLESLFGKPQQQKQAVPGNTKTQNSVLQKQTVSRDSKVQNPTQQVLLLESLFGKPVQQMQAVSMDNTAQNHFQQKQDMLENASAQNSVQSTQTVSGESKDQNSVDPKQTVSGPHLKTIINPVNTQLKKEFEIHFINVINDYHAFCLLCQKHLYSRVDTTDLYSYYMPHLNSNKHISKIESHPYEDDVIVMKSQNIWKCVPCQIDVPRQNIKDVSLKDIITNHLKEKNHKASRLSVQSTQTVSGESKDQNSVQPKQTVSGESKDQNSVDPKQTVSGNRETQNPVHPRQTTTQTSPINEFEKCEKSPADHIGVQNKWKNIVIDIRTNKSLFETYGPHLKTVINPVNTQLKEKFEIHFINVINDYHAFCLLCQKHLYSRVDSTDIYSYYMSHLNSNKHISKVERYPYEDDVIVKKSSIWKCVPCQINLQWQNIKDVNLKDIIQNHLKEKDHKASTLSSYNSVIHSALIGLSITDVFFMRFVSQDWKCTLCSVFVTDFVFGHLKSPKHLEKVISYIRSACNVDSIKMILDDQTLVNVLEITEEFIKK